MSCFATFRKSKVAKSHFRARKQRIYDIIFPYPLKELGGIKTEDKNVTKLFKKTRPTSCQSGGFLVEGKRIVCGAASL